MNRTGATGLGPLTGTGAHPKEQSARELPPKTKIERGERRAKPDRREAGVLVIGLGRFGSAIAATLDRLGQDVLAVERDPDLIAQWAGRVPLVEADATNPEALEQLGARDFGVAVVGVGSYLEASVLITGNLVDLGTPQIWAKAISTEHARILQRIGAHHIVLPEADAGSRVAHLVSGKLLDYIEVEDGFTIVKMRPPRETQGFTIAQSRIRERYGVTVIGVKSPGIDFVYAEPDTRISANDLLIVSGHAELLERFASRP
ncbi:potassium channel family protein [Cellulomonas hominis]